jgi:hypothetical protein
MSWGHRLILELRNSYLAQGRIHPAQKLAVAMKSIASHPIPILTGKETLALPGIGASTVVKIQEIIDTVPSSKKFCI